MAYKIQLVQARDNLQLKSVSGICHDGPEFPALLNEVMRRIERRGNWYGTEWLVRFCIVNGCLTWPRYVSTVLGIRACGCSPYDIGNNWFSIMGPYRGGDFGCTHIMRDSGTAPCYNEISSGGRLIRATADKLEDVGKKIVIYGEDTGAQTLMEKVGGAWQPGKTIIIGNPFGQTATLVNRITSVTKEVTQAPVRLWEYDAATNTQRDLAVYEPSETNPQYRRSIIDNFCSLPSSCPVTDGVQIRTIEALVKLDFIEVQHDLDFLPIDVMDAIKLGIQAVRLEEANQDAAAEGKWIKAIAEMNFEDRNKTPARQAPVKIRPLGRRIWSPM